jgi:hypothetical protein
MIASRWKEGHIMSDFVWDKPVNMGTGRGRAQTIRGPRDALACLSSHPDLKGPFALQARVVCDRAIRDGRDLQGARQAIVAALLSCTIPFA